MKDKIITTNCKLSDGSPVAVTTRIAIPETLDELESLAGLDLDTADTKTIENHITNLFVSWCVAHTYQSQVRSTLKSALPSLDQEQIQKLADSVPFRIPRPANAPRGDKVVLKKSQLTSEQIEKLKEMGIL